MFEPYKKYTGLSINSELIGLERPKQVEPYFCYPLNAKAIGFEGCILYCFIEGYDEMVFASNPESGADSNVYPLAKNFLDFLSLILTCGSVNPIEQIVWMSREQFEKHCIEERKLQSVEQNELLDQLRREFEIEAMEEPYSYVKAVQQAFDSRKICYRDEYYDVLGLEKPSLVTKKND